MSFHKSNYGRFGAMLPCDMDGYVPQAGDDPFAGAWDHGGRDTYRPTREWAYAAPTV